MTSSDNATPIGVTYLFQRHSVPSSMAWWPCLVCLALTSVVVNIVTCVVLTIERSLQTTLYAYLTSLTFADVIGSSVVTPIMAARTSLGQSLRSRPDRIDLIPFFFVGSICSDLRRMSIFLRFKTRTAERGREIILLIAYVLIRSVHTTRIHGPRRPAINTDSTRASIGTPVNFARQDCFESEKCFSDRPKVHRRYHLKIICLVIFMFFCYSSDASALFCVL